MAGRDGFYIVLKGDWRKGGTMVAIERIQNKNRVVRSTVAIVAKEFDLHFYSSRTKIRTLLCLCLSIEVFPFVGVMR